HHHSRGIAECRWPTASGARCLRWMCCSPVRLLHTGISDVGGETARRAPPSEPCPGDRWAGWEPVSLYRLRSNTSRPRSCRRPLVSVGSSSLRIDAVGKVTGAAEYPADRIPVDALHAKVVFTNQP